MVTKMEKPCALFGIKSVTMHPDLHLFKAINTFKEKYFCYSFQLQYFFSLTLRILKKGIGRVDPDMADLKLREIMTNFHHVSRYIFFFIILLLCDLGLQMSKFSFPRHYQNGLIPSLLKCILYYPKLHLSCI